MSRTVGPDVVDVVTAEDPGSHCDHCSDPIDRGDLVAVLSNGERVHDDGCRPGTDTDAEPETPGEHRGTRPGSAAPRLSYM